MSEPYGHYDFSADGNRDFENDEPLFDVDPADVLHKYWGYDSFRPLQREIIGSVLGGHDTIALMPTGGGKSITFQVPALMLEGLTVVISPLISLIVDQVAHLKRNGIRAAAIYMGMTKGEADYAFERIRQGKVKLLYIAPERLASERFMQQLRMWDVSLLVVDEAHCISQWGYDFRPAYLRIATVRELFPEVPVMALTASATPEVVRDIADKLEMRHPRIFSRSFERPNISFLVRHCENKYEKAVQVLTRTTGSTIVYVRSRRKTRELTEYLNSLGISTAGYHAGMSPEEKEASQKAWNSGDVRVMVATTAFGMGIDKPDVRLVIHFDMPSTLEEYYQEAGRAGRDGQPAIAVLLTTPYDKGIFGRRLAEAFPPLDFVRFTYDEICRYLNVAMGEGFRLLCEFDPEEMCRKYRMEPRKVMGAIGILQRAQYIEYTADVSTQARVKFLLRRHELYDLTLTQQEETLMDALMRNYTGLFAEEVFISESKLAYLTRIPQQRIYEMLVDFRRRHIITFIPRRDTPYIYFLTNRHPGARLIIEPEVYDRRKEKMKQRLAAMKDFAFNDSVCRVQRMLAYFGQESEHCGKCDVCRAVNTVRPFDPDEATRKLEQWLEQVQQVDLRWFNEAYPLHPHQVHGFLNTLAEDDRYIINGVFLKRNNKQ